MSQRIRKLIVQRIQTIIPVCIVSALVLVVFIFPASSVGRGSDVPTRSSIMSEKEITLVFDDLLSGYPKERAYHLAVHLRDLCVRYRVRPALILSLIQAESSFRVTVVSHKGAIGLMQIMPVTGAFIARQHDIPLNTSEGLYNPFVNLSIGVAYLASLRNYYDGQIEKFLAAFNMGPTRVDRLLSLNLFQIKPATRGYIDSIREGIRKMREYGRQS